MLIRVKEIDFINGNNNVANVQSKFILQEKDIIALKSSFYLIKEAEEICRKQYENFGITVEGDIITRCLLTPLIKKGDFYYSSEKTKETNAKVLDIFNELNFLKDDEDDNDDNAYDFVFKVDEDARIRYLALYKLPSSDDRLEYREIINLFKDSTIKYEIMEKLFK
ncbi:MAG: hypothetical protein ACTTGJ_01295 [Clostridium sp.]